MTLTLIFRPFLRFFFSCLVYSNFLYAQENVSTSRSDSLQHYSYNDLETKYNKAESDSLKILLAKAYLVKAKEANDILKIADGYYLMSESYSHSSSAVAYADSIIKITQNFEDKKYPALGYMQKGVQLYYLAEYGKALDNYLIANRYYKKYNDKYKQLTVNHYIGLLKNVLKDREEALDIFRKNMTFFEIPENRIEYRKQYLKSLFALADSYNRNKKLDSAEIFAKKGIHESYNTDGHYLYPFFLLSYGATKTLKKEYHLALDTLEKGAVLVGGKKNELAASYLMISKVYFGLNDNKQAVQYLDKVDSLYKIYPQVIFQAREGYEALLKHYREESDSKNQIKIINKLIGVDSIIRQDYKGLGKQIVKKYETPLLVAEKEDLIENLEEEKFFLRWGVVVLIILLSISTVVTITNIRKKLVYKKRFEDLMNSLEENEFVGSEKKDGTENELLDSTESIGVPEEIVDDILKKLDAFETSEKYVEKYYTITMLAKELETNRTYLSKVINTFKNDNFSNYLNDLKINYAVRKIAIDTKYQAYTIKSIAEEMGFNNAQSFANAFYKRTGIYPSYFMRQIRERKNTVKNIL